MGLRIAGLLLAAIAVSHAQDDAARLLKEANAHYLALRISEAVQAYTDYIQKFGDRADVRVYLGAALLSGGRLEEALAEAKAAASMAPDYSKSYTLAGRIHSERQNWTAASDLFEKAISLDPRDADAWYFYGRTLYEANRFEDAIAKLSKASELKADQVRVHEMLGLAREALGETAAAEADYKRAVRLARGASYRPLYAYGAFLFKQGRAAESEPLLAEALRLNPDSSDVHFELGRLYLQLGRLKQALEVLQKADPSVCRVLHLRARVKVAQGLADEAREDIRAHEKCEAARQ
jgi:tetratricopeptide (TPR) repeat protein